MKSKRATKTPFGRTLLRSSFRKTPEHRPSREIKNPGTAPFPLQQSPASQTHSASPGRAHVHECPRCGRCTDPSATGGRTLPTADWPASPGAGVAGGLGWRRGRAGARRGGATRPRVPPPARLHRRARTCPARFLQRGDPGAPLRADQRGGGRSSSLPRPRIPDVLRPLALHRPLGAVLALPQ